MKKLILKKREVDFNNFIKRTALEKDSAQLITEPTLIYDEAEPDDLKIIYGVVNIDTRAVVEALKNIKYHEGYRTRGLKSRSRIFGYRPRNAMRANYCSSTSLAQEQPTEHAIVSDLANKIEEYYEKWYPEGYKKHLKVSDEKVKKDWRINGKSVFTSGIINKNNPLKYHWDTGNFNEVYSMMIVFKEDVAGGYLSIPEYNIKIELVNNSVLMFDGQSIMHGVTPIQYLKESGHRFSIVYYSLKNIWKCLEVNEELAWARKRRTEREKMRAHPTKEHIDALKKRYGKQ